MNIEYERRFLLNDMPKLPLDTTGGIILTHIEQFYFAHDPIKHSISRCRQQITNRESTYIMCHKTPNCDGEGSFEIEHAISREVYLDLKEKMRIGNIISKNRFTFPHHAMVLVTGENWLSKPMEIKWELDIFSNGKVIAEIELPTSTSGSGYDPDDCIVPVNFGDYCEITANSAYSNVQLALNGWPT